MHMSAQTATVMVTPQQALWLELMQFYIREAWLLDERKFTEWLDLFTEDVLTLCRGERTCRRSCTGK